FLLGTVWLISVISAYYYGGILSPSYASLVLIIYTAGIITSTTTSYYYTGATLAVGVSLLYLGNNNLLPEPLSPITPTAFFGGMAVNFIIIAFFTKLANQSIEDGYNSANRNQNELEKSNLELQDIRKSLEKTIDESTKELEKRNKYLEATALVARDTTSFLSTEELLNRIVDLIAQKFDFYHAGIFLVSEDNLFADLKAASSEGGKKMIERNHRLPVGKQGIVGFVTGIGKARISQNIELDRIHTTTPELPETRSEMALPLKSGGSIIGALDIQDNTADAFTQDDVEILQILADQVSLAISNARSFEQAQISIQEAKREAGEYDVVRWGEAIKSENLPSYRFAAGQSGEAERIDLANALMPDKEGKIEIPIHVRGEEIGVIDIVKDQAGWSPEEVNLLNGLSDQLGVALDSARLFNETQQRAASERLVSEISNEIRERLDIDAILRTTAE
ncbi:MAG: GAF domain-containing protein, partial [Chloroflexota bacterium]